MSPASATITAGDTQSYTVEAFDQYGNSRGDVTGSTSFTVAPDGSCVANACGSTISGDHTVTGTFSGKSDDADLQIDAAALDHITVSPSSATITAGGTQSYTVEAFDQYGNSRGDVTGSTSFTIAPDGSCTGADCGSTTSGDHTVTGTFSGKSDDADLQIDAAALDHITVSPASATITAGGTQSYTVEAFDQYSNSRGDVTGSTRSRSPRTVRARAPTAAPPPRVITPSPARFSGKSDDADLQIDPAALDHITVSPASATITAGGTQSYTVEAFDQYGNSRGDVTGSTSFTIGPDGSCSGADCGSTTSGDHTVTGTFSGKSDDADLQIDAAALDHITVTPSTATITAGGTQSYTSEAFDQYGNLIGDVTFLTFFSMSPDGSCVANVCGSTVSGDHTVTGSFSGKSDDADLQIDAAALDHITVSPASATITAGDTQSYTVEAFDQYGNSRGDVTGSTTFTVAPDGSCVANACGSTISGDHTVTGTFSGKSDDADLQIDAAALDHITVSPVIGDDHGGRHAELHRGGVRPVRQLAWGRDRLDHVHGRPGRLVHGRRLRLHHLGRSHRHRHLSRASQMTPICRSTRRRSITSPCRLRARRSRPAARRPIRRRRSTSTGTRVGT